MAYILMFCLLFLYPGSRWLCWPPRFPWWPWTQGECDGTSGDISSPLTLKQKSFIFRLTKGDHSLTYTISTVLYICLSLSVSVNLKDIFLHNIPKGITHTHVTAQVTLILIGFNLTSSISLLNYLPTQ